MVSDDVTEGLPADFEAAIAERIEEDRSHAELLASREEIAARVAKREAIPVPVGIYPPGLMRVCRHTSRQSATATGRLRGRRGAAGAARRRLHAPQADQETPALTRWNGLRR